MKIIKYTELSNVVLNCLSHVNHPIVNVSVYTNAWIAETLWHSEQKRKISFYSSLLQTHDDDASIVEIRV